MIDIRPLVVAIVAALVFIGVALVSGVLGQVPFRAISAGAYRAADQTPRARWLPTAIALLGAAALELAIFLAVWNRVVAGRAYLPTLDVVGAIAAVGGGIFAISTASLLTTKAVGLVRRLAGVTAAPAACEHRALARSTLQTSSTHRRRRRS